MLIIHPVTAALLLNDGGAVKSLRTAEIWSEGGKKKRKNKKYGTLLSPIKLIEPMRMVS